MTVLLSAYNDAGKCVGYCNAHCYDAKQPSELHPHSHKICTCICGGKNHAAGLNRALRNMQADVGLTREYVQDFAQAHDLDASRLTVIDRTRVKKKKAKKAALARLQPQHPGPLFGLVGSVVCEATEAVSQGVRQRRE